MKNRKTLRAVWAMLLSVALLCGMFSALAEEDILIEGDAVILSNDELALAGEETFDDVLEDLSGIGLDVDVDLALDGDPLTPAEPDAILLPDGAQTNDVPSAAESEDAVPLVIRYTGDTLTKVYDCNRYGAYTKDGQTVYVIEALKTLKSKFVLTPAAGYDWVEGHDSVDYKTFLSKQFDSADVGSYEFTFRLELSGDNAAYYTLPEDTIDVPATITPREVVVTPRADLSKVYGAKDPIYKSGQWLSSDETSPLHQDISGLPAYAVPINSYYDEQGTQRFRLTVDDGMGGAYLLESARQHDTKFFPNDGWLSRQAGEKVGKYLITVGDMDFGDNFTIRLAEEYFTIERKPLTDPDITVDDIADRTYTGKALKPVPVVRRDGRKLKYGTTYTVKYSNNKNPGRATVTITGKGNYTGVRKVTFKIAMKPTTISKLTPGKGQVTVTWKKGSNNSGYQIAYSLNSSFSGQSIKTVKGISKTSLTVKGLKSRTTYYFRIRTYKTVGGSTVYSDWSAAKAVTTK